MKSTVFECIVFAWLVQFSEIREVHFLLDMFDSRLEFQGGVEDGALELARSEGLSAADI